MTQDCIKRMSRKGLAPGRLHKDLLNDCSFTDMSSSSCWNDALSLRPTFETALRTVEFKTEALSSSSLSLSRFLLKLLDDLFYERTLEWEFGPRTGDVFSLTSRALDPDRVYTTRALQADVTLASADVRKDAAD